MDRGSFRAGVMQRARPQGRSTRRTAARPPSWTPRRRRGPG